MPTISSSKLDPINVPRDTYLADLFVLLRFITILTNSVIIIIKS